MRDIYLNLMKLKSWLHIEDSYHFVAITIIFYEKQLSRNIVDQERTDDIGGRIRGTERSGEMAQRGR